MQQIHRRSFLKGSLFAAVAAGRAGAWAAEKPAAPSAAATPLALTPPLLQIPAPTSMGVAWGLGARATGFVDVGTRPDLSDSRRVFAGDGGLRALDDAALAVRLTGLAPDTAYYYRTGTLPIDFQGAYKIVPGAPALGEIYAFRTPGPKSPSSFAVINDTHENHSAFAQLAAKIAALDPALTVWNGDVCNWLDQMPKMIQSLLNPGQSGFAVSRPVLFTPGNHDYRGLLARELPRLLMTREPAERDSAFWALARNYAVRQGDLALIGLDTGEDKPDDRAEWGGLAQFAPYRELQARWLAEALERPDIASAPFVVAFCHIPLFDDSPKANPGDIAEGYASWQRPCHDLWSPLFEKHGVQLVVCAHTHKHRFDAPKDGRTWAQLVAGSGCETKPGRELTVLEGKVAGGKLLLTAHELNTRSVLGEYAFSPRAGRAVTA
jgi:UDP-2,3-diacylglucosamine pyrophosphatase LpxH